MTNQACEVFWYGRGDFWHPYYMGAGRESARAASPLMLVLRKKSVRDEFVNKNLRETLDCSH